MWLKELLRNDEEVAYAINKVGRLVDFASLDDRLGIGLPKARSCFSESESVN